jgi:hypothetical protein
MSQHQIEKARMAQQKRLDTCQSPQERNRTGQFATPFSFAQEIVRYAQDVGAARNEPIRLLEPAFGTGAFFSALRAVFPAEHIAEAVGIENDPATIEAARHLWASTSVQLAHADFTTLEPQPPDHFNLILANPPYVRHHHLTLTQKAFLRDRVKQQLGCTVNGLAGLYCYFMLLAHRWMAEDGLAIWLVPSEFMDVNYGQVLRRYLAESVTLLHIHRVRPSELQFEDALVSSAVVVFRKTQPAPGHQVKFSFGGSLALPEYERLLPVSKLSSHHKWTSFTAKSRPVSTDHADVSCLGDIFEIKRGIATGANDFFILNRVQAQELEIPEQFLRPVLPSPRYLKDNIIPADAAGFPEVPRQLVLVDCSLSPAVVRERFPELHAYFSMGEAQGIPGRYLARNRTPWYRQEQRPPAPFVCTYMGRNVAGRGALRFFWNQSRATAANVYLLLYPRPHLAAAFHAQPDLYARIWDELLKIDSARLTGEGRIYGGALHKIEPKELGRVPVSGVSQWLQLQPQIPLF